MMLFMLFGDVVGLLLEMIVVLFGCEYVFLVGEGLFGCVFDGFGWLFDDCGLVMGVVWVLM